MANIRFAYRLDVKTGYHADGVSLVTRYSVGPTATLTVYCNTGASRGQDSAWTKAVLQAGGADDVEVFHAFERVPAVTVLRECGYDPDC